LDGELAVLIKLVKITIWEVSTFEPDVATILSNTPCIRYALPVVFLQLVILLKESVGYPEKDVVIDPF